MAITCLVVACATVTDIWKGKIYNWLTLPAMFLGLALPLVNSFDWAGSGTALVGLLIGGGISCIPFAFNLLGGGDVKLLAAIGALTSPFFICETLIASLLAGGVVSLLVMLYRSRILPTLQWFWSCIRLFFTYIIFRGSKLVLPKCPEAGTIPYAPCILIGVVVAHCFDVIGWFIDM